MSITVTYYYSVDSLQRFWKPIGTTQLLITDQPLEHIHQAQKLDLTWSNNPRTSMKGCSEVQSLDNKFLYIPVLWICLRHLALARPSSMPSFRSWRSPVTATMAETSSNMRSNNCILNNASRVSAEQLLVPSGGVVECSNYIRCEKTNRSNVVLESMIQWW